MAEVDGASLAARPPCGSLHPEPNVSRIPPSRRLDRAALRFFRDTRADASPPQDPNGGDEASILPSFPEVSGAPCLPASLSVGVVKEEGVHRRWVCRPVSAPISPSSFTEPAKVLARAAFGARLSAQCGRSLTTPARAPAPARTRTRARNARARPYAGRPPPVPLHAEPAAPSSGRCPLPGGALRGQGAHRRSRPTSRLRPPVRAVRACAPCRRSGAIRRRAGAMPPFCRPI